VREGVGMKAEGGRMKDEVKTVFLSSFRLHPSSFIPAPSLTVGLLLGAP
jgi:hypothetical protein